MRPVYTIAALCLLALVCLGQCADLRASEVGSEKSMQFGTTTTKRPSASAFEQMANTAYRRATGAAPTHEAPASKYPAGECPAPRDDLCVKFNRDCSGCLATPGCGYCNDYQQCLPSAGDNPDVLGCECEVWMNEPKQCMEEVCSVVEGCAECAKKPYCVWCPHEQLCMPGGFFGIAPNKKVSCRDWRWLRCEGLTGNTVLIIAGSTSAGVLVLFFATCVVYHKCYSPVKHSAHMHDELEESQLLEDERNLLSGHHEDEHNERLAEARRSIIKVDPALDLKDNSAALKEPHRRGNSSSTRVSVDKPVTLEEDDYYSQSETDDDVMDLGTPAQPSELMTRMKASSSSSSDYGKGPILKKPKVVGSASASAVTKPSASSSMAHATSSTHSATNTSAVQPSAHSSAPIISIDSHNVSIQAPPASSPAATFVNPSNPNIIHPGLPAPSIPTTPEPSIFVDADSSPSSTKNEAQVAPLASSSSSSASSHENDFNPRE